MYPPLGDRTGIHRFHPEFMRPSKIFHLDSYRERKETRLRQTLALHGQDPERSKLLLLLWRAVTLVGGDRGAVVWLDEYGPGLAHSHVLLDLASDRPRRIFPPGPLLDSRDGGVPALLDLPDAQGRLGPEGEGVRSLCAVALGSDGPRSWFMAVDSLTPRPPLTALLAGDIMFLSGEVAAVVLHRDLDRTVPVSPDGGAGAAATPGGMEPFAGWPVLQDIEGRREDEDAARRIAARFLVARLLRGMVEDELVVNPESLAYQVKGVRGELGALERGDPERVAWERILGAVERQDPGELLSGVLQWGVLVEDQGHLHGAKEIHGLSFDLAVSGGEGEAAVDAARFQGRVCRKLARWDEAASWYGVARTVAEETGNTRKLAVVLDGLGNLHRDKGNLPKARELLHSVLALGEENDDRYARAIAHHDLMTVEKLSGKLDGAIIHGWEAFRAYSTREDSFRALFDLAGVLRECGELSSAWDAYTVVANGVEGFEYRLLALDALSFVSAVRGDIAGYRGFRARVDALGWEDAAPIYRAQILLYRGLSCRALGLEGESKEWLRKALALSEHHSVGKIIFDAEEALRDREPPTAPARTSALQDPLDGRVQLVRTGLRELREALVGAGEVP